MSKKRDRERAIFAAFLEVAPEFIGEQLASWEQPKQENDFPGIVGKTASGRRIGVELGEWLNPDEIASAKQKERIEASFLEAIGDQGTNTTDHIRYVWLRPKIVMKPSDAGDFRQQFFDFLR
jgi:hypothetical protein